MVWRLTSIQCISDLFEWLLCFFPFKCMHFYWYPKLGVFDKNVRFPLFLVAISDHKLGYSAGLRPSGLENCIWLLNPLHLRQPWLSGKTWNRPPAQWLYIRTCFFGFWGHLGLQSLQVHQQLGFCGGKELVTFCHSWRLLGLHAINKRIVVPGLVAPWSFTSYIAWCTDTIRYRQITFEVNY